MVRIQATIKEDVTPHLTALRRFVAPTPMIEPVMVCVVDTGIPIWPVKNRVKAPAVQI